MTAAQTKQGRREIKGKKRKKEREQIIPSVLRSYSGSEAIRQRGKIEDREGALIHFLL